MILFNASQLLCTGSPPKIGLYGSETRRLYASVFPLVSRFQEDHRVMSMLKGMCELLRRVYHSPHVYGSEKALIGYHYSIVSLIRICCSGVSPKDAVSQWISLISNSVWCDVSCANRILDFINSNDVKSFDTLKSLDGVDSEYYDIMINDYDSLKQSNHGIIRCAVAAVNNEDIGVGLEMIGRNIFQLDWRLSVKYFSLTNQFNRLLDLVISKVEMKREDYNYLFSFSGVADNPEIVKRYVSMLKVDSTNLEDYKLCQGIEKVENNIATSNNNSRNEMTDIKEELEDGKLSEGRSVISKVFSKENVSKDDIISLFNTFKGPVLSEMIIVKIIELGRITDDILLECIRRICIYEYLRKYKKLLLILLFDE